MAANSKTFQFKLVLLGDSAVGKSSLVLRFAIALVQFFCLATSMTNSFPTLQICSWPVL
jgi:GTPase SAR1 family protein